MEKLEEERIGGQPSLENSDAKTCSPTSSDKEVTDPVVYKLVRVEGDGRLVPATDDEVMEVENMFEEKVGAPSVADNGLVDGCISNEESHTVEAKTGKLRGVNTKVDAEKLNARLEYIGVMLQKVKQEEKLRLSSPSPDHSSNYVVVDGCSDQRGNLSAVEEKLQTSYSMQEPSLPSQGLNDSCINQLGSGETCSNPINGLEIGGSSASASCSSSMPDFSRIKGEICLDDLSIKELHETFRATFGRETSVKDKLWLKRRIAMGLTNSCDVSATTFIIKDNVMLEKKATEVHPGKKNSQNVNQIGELAYDSCKDLPTNPTVRVGQQVEACKRLRNPQTEYECKIEGVGNGQSAAKRVRKPTKRYIEEISEAETRESGGRSVASLQNFVHGQSSPRSRATPLFDGSTDETAPAIRQDSFGGSGVQVPYVSRVRRGRPRENFMSIMHYHPSGVNVSTRLDNKAVGDLISQQDSGSIGPNWKDKVAHKHIQQQVVAKIGQEKENLVKCMDEQEHKQLDKWENMDSYGDDSDCNGTLATSKDGFRRKHHRPWTLSEVVKLVEGVAKYGAGRWSEIKKVSFGSYAYRTSVDLKDKWRNLLRASFAQGSNDKGMNNSRKHGSMPIPAPILMRVRQLAEKHSQASPDVRPVKFIGFSGRSVHETRSGYL